MNLQRVEIKGRVYKLLPPEQIREAVATFQKKRGCDGVVAQTPIRDHAHEVYDQLGVYGYTILRERHPDSPEHWTRNPGVALEELGFTTGRKLKFRDIASRARQVLTTELAEDILASRDPRKFRLRSLLSQTPTGKEVLHTVNGNRKDKRCQTLPDLLSALYPELEKKYHLTFPTALSLPSLTIPYVRRKCREWFFAGEPIGLESMRLLPDGTRVSWYIDKHPLPGEMTLHSSPFSTKLLYYLDIPYLTKSDLGVESKEAIDTVSHIGERQTFFALAIATLYDPSLTSFGKFLRPYFSPPLHHLHLAPPQEDIQIPNGSGHYLEADARIVSGRDLHTLLEIKTHRMISGSRLEQMCEKYAHVSRWKDGHRIDGKVVFLNSVNGHLVHDTKNLEQHGWKVMGAEAFSTFYHGCLEALLHHEPHFFERAPIPVKDPLMLRDVNQILLHKSNLLLKRGQRYLRMWLAQLFKKNTDALFNGERFPERQTVPARTIIPFSAFEHLYGERIRSVIDNCLFYDLETAGFRNSGAPITVLGTAYARSGSMILDQYFVRNPLEEKQVLEAFVRRAARFPHVVTFNGRSFDEGFSRDRFIAHLMDPTVTSTHIDLYGDFYRAYAQERRFPHATLQTYERVALGIKRKGDIAGKDIPPAYTAYVYGEEDGERMERVLHHNGLDLLTLFCMYQDYQRLQKKK